MTWTISNIPLHFCIWRIHIFLYGQFPLPLALIHGEMSCTKSVFDVLIIFKRVYKYFKIKIINKEVAF